jgi:hypothetical protein
MPVIKEDFYAVSQILLEALRGMDEQQKISKAIEFVRTHDYDEIYWHEIFYTFRGIFDFYARLSFSATDILNVEKKNEKGLKKHCLASCAIKLTKHPWQSWSKFLTNTEYYKEDKALQPARYVKCDFNDLPTLSWEAG